MKRRTITVLASALAMAATSAASVAAQRPQRATAFADRPAIAVGTAWYPEQWPEERWATDLR